MLKVDTIKKIVPWLILLLFLAGVQWQWGWEYILRPWQQLQVTSIFLAASLFFLSYQVRTLRLYDYFNTQLRGKWLLSLRLVLLHNVLNILLPMRSGEISFPVLIKSYFSIPYSRSIPALFWFRLLDLHTILSIGLLPILVSIFPLTISIGIFILWLSLPLSVFFMIGKIPNNNENKSWKPFRKKIIDGLPSSAYHFWRSWFITWLNWLVKLFALAWILKQLLDVEIVSLLSAVIAGELSSVLPIHAPGGVGTYEVGITAVLSKVVDIDQAVQAAINIHLFVLSTALFGGIIGWLIPKNTPSEPR